MQMDLDLTRLLPDDVLADILRRVPPRSLAVSRGVCSWWRAVIDDRGILRAAADLLPRSLAGLFLSYNELQNGELFARPSVDPDDYWMPCGPPVQDHCNGLLLLWDWVHNPATGSYASLPEQPPPPRDGQHAIVHYGYLAFDPAVSPSHFEVLLVPKARFRRDTAMSASLLQSEWPPSPWILSSFSSTTGRWEERSFIRQGEAAGTAADMQLDRGFVELDGRKAEYWRGALYVHSQTDFIMRISLSNSSYRVIKNPSGFQDKKFVIGRSKNGIYYALFDECRLRVWILDESSDDQVDWKLRHDSGPGLAFRPPYLSCDPWMLSNTNCDDESEDDDESKDEEEAQVEQELEWNSDDDSVILPTDDRVDQCPAVSKFSVLAFHPYKEIVFFKQLSSRVLAYHLSTSKLVDLGKLLPLNNFPPSVYLRSCFPYTPCWMDGLPTKIGQT